MRPLAHLLTFWPPGPDDLLKEMSPTVLGIVSGFRSRNQVRAAQSSSSSVFGAWRVVATFLTINRSRCWLGRHLASTLMSVVEPECSNGWRCATPKQKEVQRKAAASASESKLPRLHPHILVHACLKLNLDKRRGAWTRHGPATRTAGQTGNMSGSVWGGQITVSFSAFLLRPHLPFRTWRASQWRAHADC